MTDPCWWWCTCLAAEPCCCNGKQPTQPGDPKRPETRDEQMLLWAETERRVDGGFDLSGWTA